MQATAVPDTAAWVGVVPGSVPGAIQRSAPGLPPASRLSERATAPAGGRAAVGDREFPAGHVDPGSIAVARGLARRDPDGSVVFDLSDSPVLSRQATLPAPGHDQPPGAHRASGPPDPVQRQEATGPVDSGPADSPTVPSGGLPSPDALETPPAPILSAAPASPGPPAHGPGGPPLDELARQLFGPLAARLKAELRLDRERAGLLTDLRR